MKIADGCIDRVEDFGLLVKTCGNHYVLNETGALVWNRLRAGDATEESLIALLAKEFGIESDVARSDLRSLLGTLQRYGLLLDWADGTGETADDTGSSSG